MQENNKLEKQKIENNKKMKQFKKIERMYFVKIQKI